MKDYYSILNSTSKSTFEDIKKSYRKLALEYHPDRNHNSNSSAKFIEITEAYEILRDEHKRKIYDDIFFKKDTITYVSTLSDWQKQAHTKADKFSKMDYLSYQDILIQELKVFSEHSSKLGCLALIILGALIGLTLIIMGAESGNQKQIQAGILSFVVYVIAVIFLYPRITSQYQNDRKNIRK